MVDFRVAIDPRPDDSVWPSMVWPDPTWELVNSNVRLTRTTVADAEPVFAALDDPNVWAHVGTAPAGPEELADAIMAAEASGRFMWTVRDVSARAALDGSVVGTSSFLEVSAENARLEVGWTLYARSHWGTYVNPATKLLLLTHAFEDLAVGRVQLKTDVRNTRSQRAIARLGATYEGTLRRFQRRRDGSVRDTVVFSITVEDWPRVRASLLERLP